MSLTTSEMTPADIAAVCGNNRNNDGFGFGGDGAWWIIILLLFGWGGRGFGNGFGGYAGGNGGGCGCCEPCATQADVRAAVDQQTLISKIDQQTYGLADSFTALNNTLNNNFRGIDNAICTLGYQNQAGVNALSAQLAQCCCDTRGAIKDVAYGNAMNANAIQQQISSCCCDIEKMNLQSRFDAQAYNCNVLQSIDKLGDRIIDYMSNEKVQALRDENQALRLAASQSAQNAFITANQEAQTAELIRRLGRDCPVPAYVVPNPNCCYQYNVTPANNCGCGCGSF
jgi:hypothetical protein